jgi:hypothetical protein
MARWFLACSLVLAAAGCGNGAAPGSDAGADAAAPAHDAGVITGDAGGTDAGLDGSALADAGQAPSDAAPSSDAGAASDGARDAGAPPIDSGVPCTTSSECGDPSMFFCEFPPTTCGGHGTCTHYGEACPLYFDPVCGCNGHTYSNAVCAQQAGQSVADPAAACTITPTCGCMRDGDCPGSDECVLTSSGGVCKMRVAAPSCWRDDDCGAGGSCVGAQVCQCGARCLVADHAGTCAAAI